LYKLYKIFIVGIVASGKTTFARKLSKELNIPYYEGDCIVWKNTNEGRLKRTPKEQEKLIGDIDKNGDWIIEGTYRESYKCLLDISNKIIYLDIPIIIRIFRIIRRFIRQKLRIESCHYKSDFDMLKMMFKWTYDFEINKSEFEENLSNYKDKLILLKNLNLRKVQR